ncbi:hypothetical protein Amsp01_019750 [Amycolatopsis sp. NBRC 101858]|uniref:hypothetical protein n=1 Tax=Amycolatopsis sp. NBRC 101858 TaxID=3032200 RepID=UPI0024A1EDD1|nr:hypothetical protein [Amycolatopsis sp. NBRC 101858]GLY35951.1 hypothetical protein Amsp01_019750 [Amycolatopsis sp. NBRC 101858]
MTDEEPAASATQGKPAPPGLREVLVSGTGGTSGRRLALHDLFALVLPEGEVPRDDLRPADEHPHLRLVHDIALLDALKQEGFEGMIWSELSDRLARYGLSVMNAWLVSGEIYARASGKARPAKPPQPPFTRDERNALAIDTVADGVELFREKGVKANHWDPRRGARLSTYFIGACVLCFTNLCRKQIALRGRADLDLFVSDDRAWEAASTFSAERVALGRIGLATVLKGDAVPHDVVDLVMTYSVLGYKSREIADLISTEVTTYTASAVRLMISQFRKQMTKEESGGGRHG